MMFSKYILRKTKSFIKNEKYHDLEKMVTRLKKRGDLASFFWRLDSTVKCPPQVWANVYNLFSIHANLFPVRITAK